jgi:ABC-type Fe3+-siderophore transport system permease subunit
VWVDLSARMLSSPVEIPAGVTSLFGGPALLDLL